MPNKQPPQKCPVCENDPWVTGEQYEDDNVYIYMQCRECDCSWTEVYVFDHFAIDERSN